MLQGVASAENTKDSVELLFFFKILYYLCLMFKLFPYHYQDPVSCPEIFCKNNKICQNN